MPADRLYIAGGRVDSPEAALAKMHARKKGQAPKIPGGLDDEDPALYNSLGYSATTGKMRVAQKKALTPEDVQRLKEGRGRQAEVIPEVPETNAAEQLPVPRAGGDEKLVVVVDGSSRSPDGSLLSPDQDPWLGERRRGGLLSSEEAVSLGGPPGSVPPKPSAEEPIPAPRVVYRDRIVEKPVVKTVEKIIERPAPWEEWIKKRVRVEIGTADTTFHVSAVDVISSGHGITVLLPTDGGAMTFTPKIGSNVTIGQKDKGAVMTRYTGVCFELEALGLFGLCFLIPPSKPQGSENP